MLIVDTGVLADAADRSDPRLTHSRKSMKTPAQHPATRPKAAGFTEPTYSEVHDRGMPQTVSVVHRLGRSENRKPDGIGNRRRTHPRPL